MAARGTSALFPIWQSATSQPALQMIDAGLKAYLTCIDPRQCPAEFAGRLYDRKLLNDLPESVDPCGEHGDFHGFVFDGPMFDAAIDVKAGEIIEKDGFFLGCNSNLAVECPLRLIRTIKKWCPAKIRPADPCRPTVMLVYNFSCSAFFESSFPPILSIRRKQSGY